MSADTEGAILEVLAPDTDGLLPKLPKRVNKQIYQNSALAGSKVEQMVNDLTNGLFGAKKPNLAIEHEKPIHRLILFLKLKGFSNREIAAQTQLTESWISQVTRQPWFQVMLVQALEETKDEIVENLVKVEATNSFFKVVQLRDTAKNEQVQLASAIRILEMHCGKPVQKQEVHHSGNVQHSLTRADQIDQELAKVRAEQDRLLADHAHGGENSVNHNSDVS